MTEEIKNQGRMTKILDYIDGKLKVNDYGYDDEAEHGYRECLKDLRAFIESLKEDKCEGCNNVKGCLNCVDGDQWAHYEVNKELEDEADEYVFGFHPSIQRMCKESFIEGAEWNREKIFAELGYQINSNYDAGYKKGARDKEKEMMKDAIEGTYDCDDNSSWISFDGWACSTSRVGNKVKLIFIEEE